uniref:Transport and Golgi organization protein 6 homolog (inferred by orthology to a human protein) n=1 Tax=Strongyloides venezuelensis TaxID=75913 RepID=A0A0K0FXS9_STRVS
MQTSLKLLDFVTTFHDVKVSKNSIIKFDPIDDAFCKGLEKFKETGCIKKFKEYSNAFKKDIAISQDPRINFSILLLYLYDDFLEEVRNDNNVTDDLCLSVEGEKILLKSLEFFISVAIYPCLEDGVGVPITKLLRVPMKEWKKYNDLIVRKILLHKSMELLFKLLNSNKKIKFIVVEKFLAIFISGNEQLIHYDNVDFKENYNKILEDTVNSVFVFKALFAQYTNKDSPKWYKIVCGCKLSKFLCYKRGLANFVTAIENLTDIKFFENSVGMNELAKLLGSCPSSVSLENYYKNILEQLFDLLLFSLEWTRKFRLIFGSLLDIVYKKNKKIVNEFFVYRVLNPWTVLLEKGILLDHDNNRGLWSVDIDQSFALLETYLTTGRGLLRKFLCSKIIEKGFFYLWISLTSQLEDDLQLRETLKNILFGVINNLTDDEKCKLFFDLLLKRGKISSIVDVSKYFKVNTFKKSNLIESEQSNFRFDGISLNILDSVPIENDKSSCIQAIFDNMKLFFDDINIQLKLLTKIFKAINLTKFENQSLVQEVEDCKEREKRNRFVNIDEALETSEEETFSLIFVLANIVEHFIKSTEDMKNFELISTETIVGIIDVVCIIIRRYNRKLIKNTYEECETLKFGIAVLAAIILVAENNTNISKSLEELGKIMKKFIILSEKFSVLSSLRDEAVGIIEIITNFLGIKLEGITINESLSSERVVYDNKRSDLFEECLDDLKDELEAVKGHGLIIIAREIRNKNLQFLKKDRLQLLFSMIPNYVKDNESYVFLSAISVLSEIAYIQPDPYLFNLIDMFVNYSDKDNVAFRGKLGEAISKVCKLLGYLAPQHFDQIFNALLKDFKNEDEIIKASSLNALADLINACKGTKYGSIIHELLTGINFLIISKDSTPLVRRSALHLLRSIIQSTDTQLLLGTVIPLDILTKIYRELKVIYKYDEDDVVKLHAQLTIIDINEVIKSSIGEIKDNNLSGITL